MIFTNTILQINDFTKVLMAATLAVISIHTRNIGRNPFLRTKAEKMQLKVLTSNNGNLCKFFVYVQT
jgi:hypothetical protein